MALNHGYLESGFSSHCFGFRPLMESNGIWCLARSGLSGSLLRFADSVGERISK
jgi:hypothetical protein